MTPSLSPDEQATLRRKLLYARWLYEKGTQDADHYDELSHMVAILHFHNAIEIVLQNVVLSYHWAGSAQQRTLKFDHLLDLVDKKGTASPQPPLVPHRTELNRLAETRNNIMHHGHRYDRSEVDQARGSCRRFLADAVQTFFEEDVEAISMADLVENQYVRRLLADAAAHRDAGDSIRAVALCAIVVALAQEAAARAFGGSVRQATREINRSAFRAGLRDFGLDEIFRQVSRALEAVTEVESHLWLTTAGVDLDAARSFFALRFYIHNVTAAGDWERNFRLVRDARVPIGQPEADKAIRFATDLALKVQALNLGPFMTRRIFLDGVDPYGAFEGIDIDLPAEGAEPARISFPDHPDVTEPQ